MENFVEQAGRTVFVYAIGSLVMLFGENWVEKLSVVGKVIQAIE